MGSKSESEKQDDQKSDVSDEQSFHKEQSSSGKEDQNDHDVNLDLHLLNIKSSNENESNSNLVESKERYNNEAVNDASNASAKNGNYVNADNLNAADETYSSQPGSQNESNQCSYYESSANIENNYDDSAIVSCDDIKITFSPLDNYTSVLRFEEMDIKKEILHGIYEMGFQRPSKIQEKALPLLLVDPPQNLIAQSQSGTGKTATFTIASLNRVNTNVNDTQVLCISPTRELARQTVNVFLGISKGTNIKTELIVKDMDKIIDPYGNHVIVGTPGTILSLVMRRKLNLSNLKCFILDEADQLIGEPNLGDQTMRIKRYDFYFC